MSEIKTNKKLNSVKLVGYLKENNLEQITNARGDKVIRGSIIVSINEYTSYRAQFYVAEKTKMGEESKDYARLSGLLPMNTTTIASYKKANEDADFKAACNVASKVWVIGRFEEYAYKSGDREVSYNTIKAFRADFSKAEGNFKPAAEFEVDVYINDLAPELDESLNETGRVCVEGLIPVYDGSVQKIHFVAPTEDGVATYIIKNYKKSDTVTLRGDLVTVKVQEEEASNNDFFGKRSAPVVKTKFVDEKVILGGSKTPIHQGEEGSISDASVKNGLAARELTVNTNTGNRKDREPAPAKTVKAGFVNTAFDDEDF